MDYMEIVKEIMKEAFDPWCFNKLEKQYMGYFDEEECLRILQKHFPHGAKNTEQLLQPENGPVKCANNGCAGWDNGFCATPGLCREWVVSG
jgi:hypothetical protein